MIATVLATLCTGLFAGAAIYITVVEHPARVACGTAAAIAQFRPSYRRAAPMQASLAAVGSVAAIVGWWQGGGTPLLVAGLLQGSVIPFTLFIIYPTNGRLLDPALDASSSEAATLLRRWGQLHLVRSLASGAAFIILV